MNSELMEQQQQAIAKLQQQMEQKVEEIRQIEEHIELIRFHPEYAVLLKDLMSKIKTESANSPNQDSILWAALNSIVKGYGLKENVNTLFDLTQLTEKELSKAHGIGIKKMEAVRKFLAEYGLRLKE